MHCFWSLCVVVLSGAFLYFLHPVLSPFLIGFLLAYMGDPIVDRFERLGLSRTTAVILCFVGFSVVTLVGLLLLLPLLGYQLEQAVSQLFDMLRWFQEIAIPWLAAKLGVDLHMPNIDEVRRSVIENWKTAGSFLSRFLAQATESSLVIISWLLNMALVPVVAFYLLRDWDAIVSRLRGLLPRRIEARVVSLVQECDEVLGAFFRGQLMVMLGLGVIYTIGLWIVGLDLALLVGMTAGLASVVPYLGFVVGILMATVAALMEYQVGYELLLVWLVFGIGQLIEGAVLTPWLVGDRIGLHPVAVIFAVLAGGQLFGFVGVLVALPVAAVIMVLVRAAVRQYKSSQFYHDENNIKLANDDLG